MMGQMRSTEILEWVEDTGGQFLKWFQAIFNGMTERLTGYLGVIQSDHAYIHEGWAFSAFIAAGSISGAYDICFKTPLASENKFIHWRPTAITSSAQYVAYQLTEGETYTDGGAVTPVNRNRNSKKTSLMQAFVSNATCTPAGTVIDFGGVGSTGTPQAQSGGAGGSEHELVLKPDTIYAFTVTPAGATTVSVQLFWYEEGGF
jgi:hypothetical protein